MEEDIEPRNVADYHFKWKDRGRCRKLPLVIVKNLRARSPIHVTKMICAVKNPCIGRMKNSLQYVYKKLRTACLICSIPSALPMTADVFSARRRSPILITAVIND